jgi:hypothetical protein
MTRLVLLTILLMPLAFGQPKKAPSEATPAENAPRQSKPDVHGWGKIRWGMTVGQSKATYGGEAEIAGNDNSNDDKYADRLVIPKLTVGDIEMKASIASLAGKDQIVRVVLSPAAPLLTSGSGGAAYEDLKTSLIRKYGKTSDEEQDEGEQTITRTSTWIFPSTKIVLLWIEIKRVDRDLLSCDGIGILHLIYAAVDQRTPDIL